MPQVLRILIAMRFFAIILRAVAEEMKSRKSRALIDQLGSETGRKKLILSYKNKLGMFFK